MHDPCDPPETVTAFGARGREALRYDQFFASVPDGFVALASDAPWTLLQQRPEVIALAADSRPDAEGWHVYGRGPVMIGEDVDLWPGAVLVPPLMIGPKCKIMAGALVAESWIGAECSIGHCVEVRDSVVFDSASIGDKSTVLDSIVGARARISGGNAFANVTIRALREELQLDDLSPTSPVVKFHESVFDTGLERFGFVVGDEVITPMRLTTDPGTMVGRRTVIYPQDGIALRGVWTDIERIPSRKYPFSSSA